MLSKATVVKSDGHVTDGKLVKASAYELLDETTQSRPAKPWLFSNLEFYISIGWFYEEI